jgi:endonuclease/exonuclease/phosphatase family metal-dependent hydrolase
MLAVAATTLRVAPFARRTIRAVRGTNRITVTWPARTNASGYTVAWAPSSAALPSTPSRCTYPCRKRYTTSTSMALSSADMSTWGRRVSSASGNPVRLKVFAQRASAVRASGITYPYDHWVAPASTTDLDWLPSSNAQLPAPIAVAVGRSISVSSFNVLSASVKSAPSWSTRAPRVVRQMNNLGSSIVATQEASNSATGVASGRSQYADLASRLAPSGWKLADDRNFDRSLGLSRWRSTQATRIFYKAAVWTQTDRGALRTHVPIQGATEGTNVDRWVSWTRLRATADPETEVCVLDAHLLANLGTYDRPSADHRNAEIAQIVSELNSSDSTVRRVGTRVGQACAGVPTVLAGDLNAAYGHTPYGNQPQQSLIDAGFVDTKNALHRYNTRWTGPGTVGSWHQKFGTQIDYLMLKGAGGASTFKVNMVVPGQDGSDHFPVTAQVNLPPVQ